MTIYPNWTYPNIYCYPSAIGKNALFLYPRIKVVGFTATYYEELFTRVCESVCLIITIEGLFFLVIFHKASYACVEVARILSVQVFYSTKNNGCVLKYVNSCVGK